MAFPYDPEFTNTKVLFYDQRVAVQVYYGDYAPMQRVVVYKVIKLTRENACMKRYFEEETATAKRYRSPNICEVYQFKEVRHGNDTYACIIMEQLERDWKQEVDLRRRGMAYYEEQVLWDYLVTLVGTLAVLQEQGLAHRDIKPDNIFVSNGRLKLGDFGSSRESITSFVNMTIQGTPCYLSPLLAAAHQNGLKRTDHNVYKSDVYSLGITFIQVLLLFSYSELSKCDIESTFRKSTRYSENLKNVLLTMILGDEAPRPDFLQLCRYLGVAPSLFDIVPSSSPFCAQCKEDAADSPYCLLPCGHFYALCTSTCLAVRLRQMCSESVFLCPLCGSQYAVDDQAVSVLREMQRTVPADCEVCRQRTELWKVCCIVLCRQCVPNISQRCPDCAQPYTPTVLEEARRLGEV